MGSPPSAGPSQQAGASIDIFISYRHADAPGSAGRLRDTLAQRFGAAHVFMDVADIGTGENWRAVLRDRIASCDVLIALIGPKWAEVMVERSRRRSLDQNEDQVVFELETALQRDSRVRVLPVLLDSATMPGWETLSRSLERLSQLNAATLRYERWDDDVAALVAAIEAGEPPDVVDLRGADEGATKTSGGGEETRGSPPIQRDPVVPRKHLETVASLIAKRNAVVPFLGSGVNRGERKDGGSEATGLADGDELAAHLAQVFQYQLEPDDLAEISQHVLLTEGAVEFYRALRRTLTRNCAPGGVHRFFAGLPKTLEGLGHPHRYQLIVTTNYDDALERAFTEANEPYDLAVYMAHGPHEGNFLHVRWEDKPEDGTPVTDPNGYTGFPIVTDDWDDHLTRTVIMKISGAVEQLADRAYPWRDNYLITENDFIDYLSLRPIGSIVPYQLLNKLQGSHLLFLGHRLRDWNLRVFLQRVWGSHFFERSPSWAIGENVDDVERGFWNTFGVVELFDMPVSTYLAELGEQLGASHPSAVVP